MIDDILMKTVIDTIPQWYTAEFGPHQYKLNIKQSYLQFCSYSPLSSKLQKIFEYANRMLPMWKRVMAASPLAIHVDFIQSVLALKWLNIFDSEVDWREIFSFMRDTANRSYENNPITLNLIISPGKGKIKINNTHFNNLLAPLASSQQTFIRVDKKLNFLEYGEISWDDIRETDNYKFNPEFLQPIVSILKKGEISVHLTSSGDVIFVDSNGIIASRRKHIWHFYDVLNFSESIINMFGYNQRACRLLETMLDISYQRHGALIVFDPDCTVIKQMVSSESSACNKHGTPDLFHKMLSNSFITPDNFSDRAIVRRKRLFLEIASIDGAVICNSEGVMAFGAMIKPHPNVKNQQGARTTAAESAYRWGGIALNVSADGYINMYFESRDDNNKCDAKLSFM